MPYIIEDIRSITDHYGHWYFTHDYSDAPSIFNDSSVIDFLQWKKILKCEENSGIETLPRKKIR
jgi:hypothetical protein